MYMVVRYAVETLESLRYLLVFEYLHGNLIIPVAKNAEQKMQNSRPKGQATVRARVLGFSRNDVDLGVRPRIIRRVFGKTALSGMPWDHFVNSNIWHRVETVNWPAQFDRFPIKIV